jgi:hypothetical protein
MANPLILHNRLGADAEVTNSVIGTDLQVHNTPVYAAGMFGNALQGGTGGVVKLNCADFFANNSIGRIDFWWYPTTGYGVSNQHLIFLTTRVSNDYFLAIDIDGSNLRMRMGKWGVSVNNITKALTSFPINNWYHIAGLWNSSGIAGGSDTFAIYADAVKVANTTGAYLTGNAGSSPTNSGIGGRPDDSNAYLRGRIDNVKFWSTDSLDFSSRHSERGGLQDIIM